MPYMQRKIDSYLRAWSEDEDEDEDEDRLPLIVKGPRQVGKTRSIGQFAKGRYDNVVEIDFVKEPKYKSIVSDGYGPDDIIRNITLLDSSKRFSKGSTLLFFDELQEFPDIATSLKFFKLDGRFDVICSGSMLGVSYQEIESNSVGYKTDYEMRSMDFEEFLWAREYDGSIVDGMFAHMVDGRVFSSVEDDTFRKLFLDYCILGGMPAVVEKAVRTASFEGSFATQRQLIADYREDVMKYAQGLDKARILNVFNSIPAQLAKENKKFQLSKVEKGARFKDYRGCVEWLEMAGMVNVCRCLSHPELPFSGNVNEKKYKLYVADTGLLVALLDEETSEDLRANKNLSVYKGALYENFAAEALSKCGMKLYYYKKENSTLEEDFFARTRSHLVPIEVKASRNTAKSLRTLIASDAYPDIAFGLKFHGGNVGHEGGVYTFPYYCTFLAKRYLSQLE